MKHKALENIENIIFDFDGVIIDSMDIRTNGFRDIFTDYDEALVDKLIDYHNLNGGLSRFNKIKYFYNSLLNKEISDEKINEYANKFSDIMRVKLSSKDVLIINVVDFIKENYKNYKLHIASGSEQEELRFLCKELELFNCFKSIYGSPIHKNQLVKTIIEENNYDRAKTLLIGDSINDYEAAKVNDIAFLGYNNKSLKESNCNYIEEF